MKKLCILSALISTCTFAQVSMDSLKVNPNDVDMSKMKVQREIEKPASKNITFSTTCVDKNGITLKSKDPGYEACLRTSLNKKNENKTKAEAKFKF